MFNSLLCLRAFLSVIDEFLENLGAFSGLFCSCPGSSVLLVGSFYFDSIHLEIFYVFKAEQDFSTFSVLFPEIP